MFKNLHNINNFIKSNFYELFDFSNRRVGLDLVRSIAVFYIFWEHGNLLVPDEYKSIYFKFLILPIEGVSTFFVLSGFLIGLILIKIIDSKEFKFEILINFFKRRWFRTFPAYFFILTILILFKFDKWDFNFLYFIFCQNLITDHPSFFDVAWSLSVEEWFYFLFPLFFYFLSRIIDTKKSLIISIIIFITLPIVLRFSFDVLQLGKNLEIRKIVFFRLDSMMYGVLLAVIKSWGKNFWKILVRWGWLIFSLIVITLVTTEIRLTSHYERIWCYNIESLLIFFILPFFDNIILFKSNIVNRLIVFHSKISYSIYLTHGSIVLWWWLRDIDNSGSLSFLRFEVQRLMLFTMYFLITYVLSVLIYIAIEKPFLAFRDKHTLSN